MEDLEEIFKKLNEEIIIKFPFFIPRSLLHTTEFQDYLDFYNLEINQYFFENYIDKLLYIDADMEIKLIQSYDVIKNYNITKLNKLENNCFKLTQLKDNLGKASFKRLLNKYIKSLKTIIIICEKMIKIYFESYRDKLKKSVFLFDQQLKLIESHLLDVEKTFDTKNTTTNQIETINNIVTSSIVKPNPKEKTIKPFRDFIIHDKKEEIEAIVKKHFSNYRGIKLRYLIEYLVEKEVLIFSFNKTKLRESIIILFEKNNVGEHNSIFYIKYFSLDDKNYKESKIVFEKIFENVF
jgi:hypothetical protein